MPRLPRFSRRLFPSELPNPPVPMSAHPHRDRLPFRFRTVENNQTSCFSGGSKLRRASRSLSVSNRPIGSRPGIPSPLDAPRVPAESRCRVTVPSKTQCDPDSRRDKWLINLGSARALNEFLSPPSPPPPPIFFAPFYRSFYIPSFPFAVILLAPLIRIVRTYVRTRELLLFSFFFFLSFSFSWCARGTRGASENVHHVRDGQGDYSALGDLIFFSFSFSSFFFPRNVY